MHAHQLTLYAHSLRSASWGMFLSTVRSSPPTSTNIIKVIPHRHVQNPISLLGDSTFHGLQLTLSQVDILWKISGMKFIELNKQLSL